MGRILAVGVRVVRPQTVSSFSHALPRPAPARGCLGGLPACRSTPARRLGSKCPVATSFQVADSAPEPRVIAPPGAERIRDNYLKGGTDYLRVLDAVLRLQSLQRRELEARLALLETHAAHGVPDNVSTTLRSWARAAEA